MRIEPDSKRIDRRGSGQLNDFDTNAVEEALQLKADSDSEVVAITMGPDVAADALRSALGLGADRAVHVADAAAVGSDLLGTSLVLAKVLERESADLVLFGQQASDGGGAMLWSAVAERLGLPVVSQAIELSVDAGRVRVTRQTEFGDDVVEAPLPAVVAVTDAINEPRYASLRGMMAAKRKPLEVLTLAELGVDPLDVGEAGAKTEVLGLGPPPVRAGALTLSEEAATAEAIVDYLAQRQLL